MATLRGVLQPISGSSSFGVTTFEAASKASPALQDDHLFPL
jgi:hypothetical protein